MLFILGILLLGLFLLTIIIYFAPTLIAKSRGHHNLTAIFVLNLCLGWSFIGWVISLVWALTNTQSRRSTVRCYHQ